MHNPDNFYLTGLNDQNEFCAKHGLHKTLLVRRLTIHLKHIQTEVFVRRTVDISKFLEYVNFELFDYVTFLTNRLRAIYKLPRNYRYSDTESIVKTGTGSLFELIELTKAAHPVLLLDFDGVITNSKFQAGYNDLVSKIKTIVVTANPTVNEQYFLERGLTLPAEIFACKGKKKKITKLKELACRHTILFYIDNEEEYLKYGWLCGIFTYHLTDKLKWWSLKDIVKRYDSR